MKSKGNFMDFVEAASKDDGLRQKWIKEFSKEGLAPEGLLAIFHKYDYDGVSLDDCDEILRVIKKPEKLATVWEQKY